MADQPIPLRDALDILRTSTKPVHLTYYTANRSKRTGGEYKVIPLARLHKKDRHTLRSPDLSPRGETQRGEGGEAIRKNPHHDRNQTINIQVLPGTEIKTVHTRLIDTVNHQKVIW